MEINGLFVLLLGLGTVFVGLICLIVIIYIMGAIMRKVTAKKETAAPVAAPAPAAAAAQQGIPNRQQFVAAVAAAIAEHTGTEADGLRIKSIKKL